MSSIAVAIAAATEGGKTASTRRQREGASSVVVPIRTAVQPLSSGAPLDYWGVAPNEEQWHLIERCGCPIEWLGTSMSTRDDAL